MKQGNQYYLPFQLIDPKDNIVTPLGIEEIEFTIDKIKKIYDGKNDEVTYNDDEQCFNVWLTESETLTFGEVVDIETRALYEPDENGKKLVIGSFVTSVRCIKSLSQTILDTNEKPSSDVDLSEYFNTTIKGEFLVEDCLVHANMTGVVKKLPELFLDDNIESVYELFKNNNILEVKINSKNAKVVDCSGMFSVCSTLITLDLSNFNTSSVTNMSRMFSYCSSLTSLDLSMFNTSKVTDMSYMFSDCSSLTSLDISNFDFSNIASIENTFEGVQDECYILVKNIETQTLINKAYPNLTNVHYVGE